MFDKVKMLVILAEAKDAQIVKTATLAIQWVANALMIIGAAIVTVNLIRTGIRLSGADSPEAAQKCKKQIFWCILGLVIILSAAVVINILSAYIPQWLADATAQ